MADKDTNKSVKASKADSKEFTEERRDVAEDRLDEQQQRNADNADLVDDRPLDMGSMSKDEQDALETQNEIASPDYKPTTFDENISQFHESSDSPFALSSDAPDYSGPEAHDEAVRTGVNPRTLATSSDPEFNYGRKVSKSSTDENPQEVNK